MKRWLLLWWLAVAFAVAVLIAEVLGRGWGPVISWHEIGVVLIAVLNLLATLIGD